MRCFTAVVLGLIWTASYADAEADMAAKLVKQQLTESCEDDSDCAYAVRMQFDACHRKFRKEWQAYMDASGSEEDRYLTEYSNKLYACIVNEDGEPYFEYQPE